MKGQVKHAVFTWTPQVLICDPQALKVCLFQSQLACQAFSTESHWRADATSAAPSVISLHGSYRVETLQIFMA